MSWKSACLTLAVWLAGAGTPRPAEAQPLDRLGNRPAALGAFVAVADDASAVAWNPAGLVNGPIFNILLDFQAWKAEPEADVQTATRGSGRLAGSFLAVGILPLGISYYRMRQSEADPGPIAPAAEPSRSRENRQVVVRSLVTSHLGLTVLQSLSDGLTVGATLKLVRGSLASAVTRTGSWGAALDDAEMLAGRGRTTPDVDAGALYAKGRFRVGVVARHLAAPTFDDGRRDGASMTLGRHVRAGAAWGDGWPGTPKTIVAVDADVTRVSHLAGDRRDVAAGGERWFGRQRFAVRGGLRASTVGDRRPIASGGGSVAVRSGIYVDGFVARGSDGDRSWGVAARLMY